MSTTRPLSHAAPRHHPALVVLTLAPLLALLTGCPEPGLPADCEDADGDGYTPDADCGATTPLDCDDGDAAIHPGADEPCDLVDNDCDGKLDNGCAWECGDGVASGSYEECDGVDDAACPGACSAHCACPAYGPGPLRLWMLDVGQGDAFVVVTPDGFAMAVDAGSSGAWDDLRAALQEHGLDALDYTLVSHMHSDHLGGMWALLDEHTEVSACFDHGGGYDTSVARYYRDAAAERRLKLVEGDTIDLGPSVQADVLHARVGGEENLNSIVLRITYGDHALLLGGDCETWGCEDQLETGPIDVYKVHHHGSSGASSNELLDQMMPSVALIPVGAGNSYGHPHAETLARLAAHDVEVWRTDQDGDVLVVVDGDTIEVEAQ